MIPKYSLILAAGCWLAGGPFLSGLARGTEPEGGEDFFERRVRPVLVERCLECHGAEVQESGLRLDSREAMLRGGDRGPAIELETPQSSRLIRAVRHEGELKMPPERRLLPAELAALEAWLNRGAPWPNARPQLTRPAADLAREERLREIKARHWAFQPVVQPAVPTVATDWRRNPIDHFVWAKLSAEGLAPAPEASPQTLTRRLYFDLLGLPPDAAALAGDSHERTGGGYEQLVDDLLNRPEYGERWARHWLDVARYADTTGYQEGGERRYPFAWTYRDYVVRSFNEDTPFDQFVVEQLAADQLELGPDQSWKQAAMGWLTLGPRFNYVRHEIIDDRIDVVTRGFLGLTVTCARCHDHKYDPVLADDYYGLYGVFASSQEPLYTDLPRLGSSQGDFARYRQFRTRVAQATRRFEQFHARVHREAQYELRSQAADYLRYLVQLMPAHRTVEQPTFETERGRIRGPTPYGTGAIVRWQHYLEQRGDDDPVFGLWNRWSRFTQDELAAQLALLNAKPASVLDDSCNSAVRAALLEAAPQSMLDVAGVYGELLERTYAEWNDYRASQPAATELPDADAEQVRQVLYADDSPVSLNVDEIHDCYTDGEFGQYMGLKRELDSLFVEYQDVAAPRAMVLVDRPELEEPRVFLRGNATRPGAVVERRFLRAFAEVAGDEPFAEGSGRLSLARAIASPRNPLTARVLVNRVWQWHFGQGLVDTPSDFGTRAAVPSHPELLDWLAADFMAHGWSLKRLHRQIVTSATYRQASQASPRAEELDPENRWLSHMNRRRLGFEELRDALLATAGRLSPERGGPPVDELDAPRRSLYLLVNRDDPSSVRATFDFPSADLSAEKRVETTVPQQALFLMNSPFASAMAERLLQRMPPDLQREPPPVRIDWLYHQALGRSPDERELALALSSLASVGEDASTTMEELSWRDFAHVLLMSNEFLFVD